MASLVILLLQLFTAFFLVFMNGVFVAAEFAFVRARPSRIEAVADEGSTSAKLVTEILDDLDGYLAVCQLGITISSLGLGWIGEPAVAALIGPVLQTLLPEDAVHVVAVTLGFGLITFLHVVFGELAPKTFSIQDAEKISLLVALPMKVFYYLFLPGIIVFNGTANFFTRLVGYPPASEIDEVHTEEDILMLVSQSRKQGAVDEEQEEMIEGVFKLGNTAAREIMIPRLDVVTLEADMPLSEILTIATTENYTSYPVLKSGESEDVVGAVHIEDVLRAMASNNTEGTARSPTARDLARDVLVVPENRRIDDLMSEFQAKEIQMAVVFDEWGTFEGIVTLEDILEEIVGEIRDEFDLEDQDPSISKLHNDEYAVDGRVPITRVNKTLNADFESEAFDTISGLILDELGRAPHSSLAKPQPSVV